MPTKISIAVFRGDPIDLIEYRHTALHFIYNTTNIPEDQDQQQHHSKDLKQDTTHVTNKTTLCTFQIDPNRDSSTSSDFEKSVFVAYAPDNISRV